MREVKRISLTIIVLICLYKTPLYIPDTSCVDKTDEERKYIIDDVFNKSWDYDKRKYRRVVNKKSKKNNLLEEIETHKENFYFLDFGTTIQSLYYEWDTLKTQPIGYWDNFMYLSGVSFQSRDNIWKLEKRGINNVFPDLTEENIFLVDNTNVEIKLRYLQEHYYPNARAELYKELSGYQIWKIYKE